MGRKARRGPVKVVYAKSSGLPAVAFAVPAFVGTAVVRNRVRRRLRGILCDIAREKPELLKGGDYLFSVSAPLERLSYDRLLALVLDMLHELRTRSS